MRNEKKRNTWIIIPALLCSFFLWIYVVTVVNPEITETIYDIPVVFSGEDTLRNKNLLISSGAGSTVNLTVSGKRSDISSLNRDNISITVDVSKIRAASEFSRSYSIAYPAAVSAGSVSVVAMEPEIISFTVEQLVDKDIPVEVDYSACTFAAGYKLDSCKPVVDSITVTGTEKQVKSLAKALVILDDTNLSENFTRNEAFTVFDENNHEADLSGLTLDYEKVGVSLKLLYVKQIPLVITVEPSDGATEANLDYTVTPAYITVSGDEDQLGVMNKIVLDTVYMSGILEDTKVVRSIVLPDGVKNESGVIEATVDMKLVGLETKTVRATKVDFRNQPSGYEVFLDTESVPVQLRGTAQALDSVSASDIRIVVDLSAFSGQNGKFKSGSVKVILENSAPCDKLGSYTVEFTMISSEEYLKSLEQAEQPSEEQSEGSVEDQN